MPGYTRTHVLLVHDVSNYVRTPVALPPLQLQELFAEQAAAIGAITMQQRRMATAADQLVNSLMARFFSVSGQEDTAAASA